MCGKNEVILKAENIIKNYDKLQVLNLEEFKLYKGDFHLLLGPNGSGKTTLLKILSLIDREFKGKLYYKGKNIKNHSNIIQLRRKFSVIWQNPYFFKGSTAHNIILPLKLRNIKKEHRKSKLNTLAKKLEISELLSRKCNELSGGERQKVSIARALISEPEILFIDEPTNNLDFENRQYFHDLFLELAKKNITILLISHDEEVFLKKADKITYLKNGNIKKEEYRSII